MAATNTNSQIDPNSGFCSETKIFHSLRPSITLPPQSQPLSVTQFAFSLLHSNTTNISETPFLINTGNGHGVTFSEFLHQTKSLAFSLQEQYSLSKGDVAFILSHNSLQIPTLYFSLLSLGVIIATANPDGSISELTHQIKLTRPTIAFATSQTSHKLPPNLRTVMIDSPEFSSLLNSNNSNSIENRSSDIGVVINQSDVAAILFSSGTTGRNKGVLLTHRNFIAVMASHNATYPFRDHLQVVSMATRALFGVFGLTSPMRAVIMGETLVFPETFELEATLEAVDKYKATCIPVSPSFIVALVKSDLTNYHLSSLRTLICGGAPLGNKVSDNFREKFPNIGIINAKIIDPVTGETLSPGQRGELWLRCPNRHERYPDEDAGQIPMAFVVGPYKKIQCVAFIDSVLKSVTGKILRRELVNYALFDTVIDLSEEVLRNRKVQIHKSASSFFP
ncbi:hypothetical protein QYF36_026709 [Acer negundo]|nr:hypothetical protein QYF36_026709 [Acer negundo]